MSVITIVGRGVAALSAVALLAGCGEVTLDAVPADGPGGGEATSEQRDVQGFTAVELATSGSLEISHTGTESLQVEAEAAALPRLTSEVVDGTLVLGVAEGETVRTSVPIRYVLTVADLDTIGVTGSGDVTVPDLATDDLLVEVAGSGSVEAGGTADRQRVRVSGSGDYRGDDLVSSSAEVEVSGSGDVEVAAEDTLDVRISGSGSVTYSGDPVVTQDVSGSGEVAAR